MTAAPPVLGRRRALAAALALGLARPARAAAWPDGPLTMIVPFPPGSTPDVVARLVADHLRRTFDRPVIADNRPGAGGTIGTGLIARAHDGRTFGVTINGPVTTATALYPDLAYDPATDLAYVSLLARTPQLLVVHPDVPATDLASFVSHARSRPGGMAYGSVGVGSAGHLAMADLEARRGIGLVHVPYKGFPEATADLVAGRIQAMVVIASGILPQVRAGTVRALLVTAEARIEAAPEVPTAAEAGLPEAVSYAWIGLVAPAATPPERVRLLADAAAAGLAVPETRAALEKAGYQLVASRPESFARFAAEETARWSGLVHRLGIKPGQ